MLKNVRNKRQFQNGGQSLLDDKAVTARFRRKHLPIQVVNPWPKENETKGTSVLKAHYKAEYDTVKIAIKKPD